MVRHWSAAHSSATRRSRRRVPRSGRIDGPRSGLVPPVGEHELRQGPAPHRTVATGRTSEGALLAVLYPLPQGRFAHASSTLIAEPEATLAVGASAQYPAQLNWTTCYACAGEGGTIRLRDDARVELGYR